MARHSYALVNKTEEVALLQLSRLGIAALIVLSALALNGYATGASAKSKLLVTEINSRHTQKTSVEEAKESTNLTLHLYRRSPFDQLI